MRIRKRPRTSGTNFMHYNSDIGTAFPNDASNPSGVSSPAEKDAGYNRQQISTPNFHVRKQSKVGEIGSPDLENRKLKNEGRLSHGSNLQHTKEGWLLEVDHALRVSTDSLHISLCRVLSIAGGSGLTAREAASKIKEKGFAGLNEASSVPSSVKITKLLRSSPQFKETAGGKFIMSTRIQSCSSLQEALGNVNDEKSRRIKQQQKANQVMTSRRYKGSLLGSVAKKLKQPISSNDEIDTEGEQLDRKRNRRGKLAGSQLPSSSYACLHQNPCFKSQHKTTGILSPQVISTLEEPHCGNSTPQDHLIGAHDGHLHSESNPRRRKRVKARYLMSIMRTST